MSGPVETVDFELLDGRETVVGEITVRRVLPRRGRRTVGAWCFADHMGPEQVTETRGLDIGPHPHSGLHTVTWLVSGAVLHRDSLGSEQLIRPGQLNLMTAGHGVAHSEEATGTYRGTLHGVQLWVAQPDDTRNGAAAFEHHAELPRVSVGSGEASVLVGEFGEVTSPARADTALVGVEGVLAAGSGTWPLRRDFEYAVVVLEGAVAIGEQLVVPGRLAYLSAGREELVMTTTEPTRVLLLGGVPFPEPIFMWWNFVARNRAEAEAASRQWNAHDERFGEVRSALPRIAAPTPP